MTTITFLAFTAAGLIIAAVAVISDWYRETKNFRKSLKYGTYCNLRQGKYLSRCKVLSSPNIKGICIVMEVDTKKMFTTHVSYLFPL
jgi:hypothetical protein